jgi:hypothetical protein
MNNQNYHATKSNKVPNSRLFNHNHICFFFPRLHICLKALIIDLTLPTILFI